MPAKTNKSEKIAIVDIGSNSVRLVIYALRGKRTLRLDEKKVTCGLARGMTHKKPRLNRKGSALALKALRKFRLIIDRHEPQTILAIGTAAMRAVKHTNKGRAFHRKAENALGHKIDVISGRLEARLTAMGVMAVLPKAAGICGDLGGGSLELASIRGGKVGHTTTLPLGSLTLITESGRDALRAEALMRGKLRKVGWLKAGRGKTFYPIGGSWRAIARIIKRRRGKSWKMVQGYSVSARVAKRYAAALALQPPSFFRRMPDKIRARADVIPYAAAVLHEIISLMQPARVTFSGHGVREGLLASTLKD
ncbi:MAG: hypothetical protein AB7H77_09435 [Bdellovibrionales bacterium]